MLFYLQNGKLILTPDDENPDIYYYTLTYSDAVLKFAHVYDQEGNVKVIMGEEADAMEINGDGNGIVYIKLWYGASQKAIDLIKIPELDYGNYDDIFENENGEFEYFVARSCEELNAEQESRAKLYQ